MKQWKKLICMLAVFALLGTLPQTASAAWTGPGKGPGQKRIAITPFDDHRRSWNYGSCGILEGSPAVVVIYLDDDASSWSQEDVSYYNAKLIRPALEFMEENAQAWNIELSFQMMWEATCAHPQKPVKYNGTVDNYNTGVVCEDVLDQVALSLGYESKEDMHRQMQKDFGYEQVSYVLMMDKGGRSYSIASNRTSREDTQWADLIEYSLIFTGFTDTSRDSASDTIVHEMLHQFGAEDYYYPENRKILAQNIYPTDIMLCAMSDLEFFTLEDYTAFCLGWTDRAPRVCSMPGWYAGTR